MKLIGGGGSTMQSEINVTPLVDVVLVLLIIFMVILPLTLHGHDLDVAKAEATLEPAALTHEQIVLAIEPADCPALVRPEAAGLPAACSVKLNDDTLAVAELPARLAELFAARPPAERVLFLAADDRLNYEAVLRIIDASKSAVGGLRVGMVTAP